jgi:hypothetical protein
MYLYQGVNVDTMTPEQIEQVYNAMTPEQQQSEIIRALNLMFNSGDAIEFRALQHGSRKPIISKCGDWKKLAEYIQEYVPSFSKGLYVTLNPVDPSFQGSVNEKAILRRQNILIDCDVQREPKDTNSTHEEHEAAIAKAKVVREYLKSQGWPEPILTDSGNGAHLVYRVELPVDEKSTKLVKQVLKALAQRFSDKTGESEIIVKIDTGVADLSSSAPMKGFACASLMSQTRMNQPSPHATARCQRFNRCSTLSRYRMGETWATAQPNLQRAIPIRPL